MHIINRIHTLDDLKRFFPDGEADEMNFVLFSTSGVHGDYITIEEIKANLIESGREYEQLTVLVIQPRLVAMHYGYIDVTLGDIPYLKNLRQSSWDVCQFIGRAN